MSDWGLAPAPGGGFVDVVAEHLARVQSQLENDCNFVFQSLRRIANNHRDRMRLFGRIPERNKFLGRHSSAQELATSQRWIADHATLF